MDLIARATKFMIPDDIDVVFFHSPCLDGTAAAYTVNRYIGDCMIFGWNPSKDILERFGDKFFHHALSKLQKNIMFIGCAPSLKSLGELRNIGFKVIVLDYHFRNKQNLDGKEGCFFDMKRSACMLAWDYFSSGEKMPRLLSIIGNQELGRYSDENKFVGMALTEMKVAENLMKLIEWIEKEEEGISELTKKGKERSEKLEAYIDSLKPIHKVLKFGDRSYGFLSCETTLYVFTTEVAERFLGMYQGMDFMLLYYKDEKTGKYVCSLRTIKEIVMDVSKIAAAYGGGGTPKAAAFVCDRLPW